MASHATIGGLCGQKKYWFGATCQAFGSAASVVVW